MIFLLDIIAILLFDTIWLENYLQWEILDGFVNLSTIVNFLIGDRNISGVLLS